MKKLCAVVVLLFAVGLLSSFSVAAEGGGESVSCFNATYTVEGLKPLHDYVLCINGYSDHQSNKVLLGIGQLWRQSGEGYCDFAHATTDKDGTLSLGAKKALPAGSYKVKFLVKDPNDDWKVVWNKDEIEFTVGN